LQGELVPKVLSSLRKLDDFDCDLNENGLDFSIRIHLDLAGKENLFDVPFMKWYFENRFKRWLNRGYAEDDIYFSSVAILRDNRQASAIGFCRKSNKCLPKPDFTFPTHMNQRYMNHSIESINDKGGHNIFKLIEDLKKSNFEAFKFVYRLNTIVSDTEVNYEALFKQEILVGFSELEYLSITTNEEDINVNEAFTCTTEECADQRSVIASIFMELDIVDDLTLHECAWEGVTCNEDKKVTQLWIENRNTTTRAFPNECRHLIHLTDLVLRNNGLTGSLPSDLGALTNLMIVSFVFCEYDTFQSKIN